MTKEQIAKKAAREAALATYKAILNPPIWKVAGTSFQTSPTWKDMAKAAAAAAYSAIMKMAQSTHQTPGSDDIGIKDVHNFGIVGLLKDQPKSPVFKAPPAGKGEIPDQGKGSNQIPAPGQALPDRAKADVGNVLVEQQPVTLYAIGNVLEKTAPEFASWVKSYGKGPMPEDAKLFADYVKSPGIGRQKENWANAGNWTNIVMAIASNLEGGEKNPGVMQLLQM